MVFLENDGRGSEGGLVERCLVLEVLLSGCHPYLVFVSSSLFSFIFHILPVSSPDRVVLPYGDIPFHLSMFTTRNVPIWFAV